MELTYTQMVFAIVGIVLLVFPGRWFARIAEREGDPRHVPVYRRRVAVFRSAGVSLLIVALISYFLS